MVDAWVIGIVVGLALALVGWIFRRFIWRWIMAGVQAVRWRLYLRARDERERAVDERITATEQQIATAERAIDRIAAELAQRRCSQEGNPDDEYYSDWYHWFTGDPEANVDYSRKQQRDLERMRSGFRPGQ